MVVAHINDRNPSTLLDTDDK